MIDCLLIRTSRNERGERSRSEARITGESIELGRGAACHIHLADERVQRLHAAIRRRADGSLQIEAASDALLDVDGFLERAAALRPGMRIAIGPYLLTVKPAAEDCDVAVELDMAPAQAQTTAARAAPVRLAPLGIGKRKWGLALAGCVLALGLLLPLLPRVSPTLDAWLARAPSALATLQAPGALSAGHSVPAMDCGACHQTVFSRVADTACAKCHPRIGLHLAAEGDAGAPSALRCADCHAAHAGKAAATTSASAQCVACHRHPAGNIAPVRDFGSGHPAFRLTLPQGKDVVRVRQDGPTAPRENAGLKFSHQLHLDKEGVKSPEGQTVLTCGNCHLPDASGIGFAPMKMETTCQQSRCHRQFYSAPERRPAPHASEREVMSRLREHHINWLADTPAEAARRCGPQAMRGTARQLLDCADRLARDNAAATLFRDSGERLECALCHPIEATGRSDAPWQVERVRIRHDRQPLASFPHARHAAAACTACHDKAGSKTSADVSLPGIEKCRECHAGTAGAAGRLATDCESCHRFHRHARKPS